MRLAPSPRRLAQLLRHAAGFGWLICAASAAASPEQTQEAIDQNVEVVAATSDKNQDLLIVPIPQSNPAIGSGLAIAAAMIYQPEGSPRPWVTGVGALYTDSKSKALGAVQKAYLAGGRFRLSGAAAYGDFNIDFYGVGGDAGESNEPIAINQRGWLVTFDGQVRVAPNLFAGLHYRLIDTRTSSEFSQLELLLEQDLPERHLDAASAALGPVLIYDSRDNEYAPGNGEYATAMYLRSFGAIGSDFDYGKLLAEANIYRAIDDRSVIAGRVSMCAVEQGAPFFDLCLYGSSKDLRGYASGQYRDRGTFATQVEYRRRLFGRFGAVAFAGVGGISDKFTNFDNYRILPAAGVGLRYATSEDFGVNVSVDFAWGKGSSGLYLYVSEAF